MVFVRFKIDFILIILELNLDPISIHFVLNRFTCKVEVFETKMFSIYQSSSENAIAAPPISSLNKLV